MVVDKKQLWSSYIHILHEHYEELLHTSKRKTVTHVDFEDLREDDIFIVKSRYYFCYHPLDETIQNVSIKLWPLSHDGKSVNKRFHRQQQSNRIVTVLR